MRILVLGATGTAGRSTMAALLSAGHDVTGHARGAAKAALVARSGASYVRGDADDPAVLMAWLRAMDALVDLRVRVPPPRRAVLPFSWREYARLRGIAAGVAVDCALAAGVPRVVHDTVTMVYRDGGDAVLTESSPVDATGALAANLLAERHLARFTDAGGVGVALRLGQLYGPDDVFSRYLLARARAGRSAVLGDAEGYTSALHTSDVGPAVLAALSAPAGPYNVVDDEPLRRAELVGILAAAVGRDRLRPGPRAAPAAVAAGAHRGRPIPPGVGGATVRRHRLATGGAQPAGGLAAGRRVPGRRDSLVTEQAGTAPAALAPRFDALRPELLALAYRLLGSRSDAEDVVQDAWVRLHRSVVGNGDPPDSLRGWARTTVSRLCLDLLTSARRRREAYIGQWLPEPWIIDDADPQDRISLDESVGYALLVVLQTLSPAERTAWVLHVSFGMPYDQVGTIVGRTAEACRQLVARARRHLADRAPRFDVDAQAHRRVVDRFMAATAAGDLAGLVEVLDPNVTWRGDGGGKVSAARRPVTGSLRVAGLLLGVIARSPYPDTRTRVVRVNGGAGLLVYAGDRLVMLAVLSIADDVIVEIDVIVNPDKLAQVDPASTDR